MLDHAWVIFSFGSQDGLNRQSIGQATISLVDLHICAYIVSLNSWNFLLGTRTKKWNFAPSVASDVTGTAWVSHGTFRSSKGTTTGDLGNVKFFVTEYKECPSAARRTAVWFSTLTPFWDKISLLKKRIRNREKALSHYRNEGIRITGR